MGDIGTNNVIEIPSDLSSYKRVFPEGKVRHPQGIFMDSMDTLLVCGSRENSVFHANPQNTTILSRIHRIGMDPLQYPVNVTMLSDGTVVVLDGFGKLRMV